MEIATATARICPAGAASSRPRIDELDRGRQLAVVVELELEDVALPVHRAAHKDDEEKPVEIPEARPAVAGCPRLDHRERVNRPVWMSTAPAGATFLRLGEDAACRHPGEDSERLGLGRREPSTIAEAPRRGTIALERRPERSDPGEGSVDAT